MAFSAKTLGKLFLLFKLIAVFYSYWGFWWKWTSMSSCNIWIKSYTLWWSPLPFKGNPLSSKLCARSSIWISSICITNWQEGTETQRSYVVGLNSQGYKCLSCRFEPGCVWRHNLHPYFSVHTASSTQGPSGFRTSFCGFWILIFVLHKPDG